MRYVALTLLVWLGLATLIHTDAYAHGRVFIGGGVVVGAPYYAYPPYYGYPYYAYPPAYPPGYAVPYQPAYAPAYAAPYQPPPPTAYDQYYRDEQGEYCREYKRTIMVEGRRQQAYGHACRQPDGAWRIVD